MRRCRELLDAYNSTGYDESEQRKALLREMLGSCGEDVTIQTPFKITYGMHLHVGSHVFINYNAVMLDSGFIRIGNHVKIGPNCQFYTPNHPMDYMERRKPQETAYPITIGDDCWIAGGVTICPGVTIGKRCIIAAGSVVTKDVPDDSLVAGIPAIVKRKLN